MAALARELRAGIPSWRPVPLQTLVGQETGTGHIDEECVVDHNGMLTTIAPGLSSNLFGNSVIKV
jgi:hypothetical protein